LTWKNKAALTITRMKLFNSIVKFKEISRYFEKVKGILIAFILKME